MEPLGIIVLILVLLMAGLVLIQFCIDDLENEQLFFSKDKKGDDKHENCNKP